MPDQLGATRPKPLYLLVFAGTLALSLVLGQFTHLREAAVIILFAPLVWSFMSRGVAGMVISGAILAMCRISIEAIQLGRQGEFSAWRVMSEAMFPLLLYVMLGVAFYVYRLRQANLTKRIIETQALEAREQLAGSIVYDYSPLLKQVMQSVERIRRNPGECPAQAESILQACKQGIAMIDELLNVSDAPKSRMVRTDLNQLVGDHLELVRRLMPDNIRLALKQAAVPLPAVVDPGQMLRVMTRIGLLARNRMAGGGTLTIRLEEQESQQKMFAVITFSDSGGQIGQQEINWIFDSQRDASEQSADLSVVQSIVLAHGGRLNVRSAQGAGTIVTISLPLATGE